MGIEHFLILSAILFSIGLFGALSKSNAVVVLMCIEIMLQGVNIALVAFSRYAALLTGQLFALFVITVAAAEIAVGLAIVIALYRARRVVEVERADMMRE